MIRMIKGEWQKMRHTLLLALHLWIPFITSAVFLLYFRHAPWEPEQEVYAYVEVLGAAYPFLSAVICQLSVELEEQGHCQLLFLAQGRRWKGFAGKWAALMLLSLGSVLFAMVGFGLFYGGLTGEHPFLIKEYLLLAFVLWGGQLPVYLLHLMLGFVFGRAVSIITGVGEAVLAALLLTGLGDGRWMILPCTFSGRWSSYLLLYEEGMGTASGVRGELILSGAITILLMSAVFVWFCFFEGRRCSD